MIFRTDIPKGSPIVIYRTGSKWPEILFLAEEPYEHYYDDGGEEIPIGMIQKWASLEEESPLPSNLDEAAEKCRWKIEEHCVIDDRGDSLYSECDIENAFKAGVEYLAGQGASFNTKVGWIDGPTILDWPDNILDGFKMGDEVIVQIRKK